MFPGVLPSIVLASSPTANTFFLPALSTIATTDGAMDEMIKKANGRRTVPQIFFDEHHIGGYDDIRALEKENKLQDLLK